MKRVMILVLTLVLLTGCAAPAGEAPRESPWENVLNRWERELSAAGAESIAMQEELARWYNYRLSREGDWDDGSAYSSILFYTDGVLGAVEFPSLGLRLPIYHGSQSGALGHDPASPFPIGETGDHPLLVTEIPLSLDIGEEFIIHILENSLTYRIAAIRQSPDTSPVPGMDYCSILLGGSLQLLGIRVQQSA